MRSQIFTFMDMKGKLTPELNNDDWICELAFLVDVTTHLNELNSKLQSRDQLVYQLYSHVKTFQNKIQLWERQLRNRNTFHFSTLANHDRFNFNSYAEE